MLVRIKASDVAACIGRHQYKPRAEVIDSMWKRYWPSTFEGLTKEDRAQEALSNSTEAQEIIRKTLKIRAKDSNEANAIMAKAREQITLDAKLSDAQKVEVIEHIRSKVSTTHGTRSEDLTADKVTADEGATLVRDEAFYQKHIASINGIDFCITGKIDRIEERPDGSRVLVEIKNRMNRLFRKVPEYEMIQVQVYLQMLNLVQARLIEQHNNQVASHDIERDDVLWREEILPALVNFCEEIVEKANV
jgi:hypothetical protein